MLAGASIGLTWGEHRTFGAPISVNRENEDAFCRDVGQVSCYPEDLPVVSYPCSLPHEETQRTFQATILTSRAAMIGWRCVSNRYVLSGDSFGSGLSHRLLVLMRTVGVDGGRFARKALVRWKIYWPSRSSVRLKHACRDDEWTPAADVGRGSLAGATAVPPAAPTRLGMIISRVRGRGNEEPNITLSSTHMAFLLEKTRCLPRCTDVGNTGIWFE